MADPDAMCSGSDLHLGCAPDPSGRGTLIVYRCLYKEMQGMLTRYTALCTALARHVAARRGAHLRRDVRAAERSGLRQRLREELLPLLILRLVLDLEQLVVYGQVAVIILHDAHRAAQFHELLLLLAGHLDAHGT